MTNVQPHWPEAVRASALIDAAGPGHTIPTAVLTAVFGDRRTGLDLLGIHPDMAAGFGFDDTPVTSAGWAIVLAALASGRAVLGPQLVDVPEPDRPGGEVRWYM
jgi:hypothetical protein